MKIQVISYNKNLKYRDDHEFTFSSLGSPETLDAFDINIISLQTELMWKYDGTNANFVDCYNDLQSLKALINRVNKSKVIIFFPQNYTYSYGLYGGSYSYEKQLKDMIPNMKEILKFIIPENILYELIYENSTTTCNGMTFKSAFCFSHPIKREQSLTKCLGSECATTYLVNSNLIFTTLDLCNPIGKLNHFLVETGLLINRSDIPIWINDFEFFDDSVQKNIVSEAETEIENQKQIIQSANNKLNENLRYKSILYESGDKLVEVVFDILEKMLNCSLADFVDEKKEDFRITLDEVTFIGEIKGITSNVRSENVSQLDVHCQSYSDLLQEIGKTENIKGILIVNPFRGKPITARDEVHENQIKIANRNGSLIVTTETLLHLFVAFLENKITSDEVINLFKNKIGLLKVSDFIK